MNFYEHQDRARRTTALLGCYFVFAVVLTVVAINVIAWLGVASFDVNPEPLTYSRWLERPYAGLITAMVLIIIIGTSVATSLRLSAGGAALARILKARRVDPDTRDAGERRLVNVVDEMSIAAGIPAPVLYLLDEEPGLNAFVAGMRPSEAVLMITRGALATFSRDELQGVVAHEYNHILNADMRLNLHLMGALAGLIVVGQIGRFMLHSGRYSRSRGSAHIALAGVAILGVGFIGSFFGAVIKAAISRQREFLADASAVQFTRNPDGIAHALYRIKMHHGGSLLASHHAEDISHFCFGESVHYALSRVMASHPPLQQRIRAISPHFVTPNEQSASASTPPAYSDAEARPAANPGNVVPAGARGFSAAPGLSGRQVAEAVGTLGAAELEFAQICHQQLPKAVQSAVHSNTGAVEMVLALLSNCAAAGAAGSIRQIIAQATFNVNLDLVEKLALELESVPAQSRLPLVNMALPALKRLDTKARDSLITTLRDVIAADRRFSVFEFALVHIIANHLQSDAARKPKIRYFKFSDLSTELGLLLSVLAYAGHRDDGAAAAAYAASWGPFGLSTKPLVARQACKLSALNNALDRLAALSPLLKKNVIRACADCVIHDGTLVPAEAELLQVIALNLDCPLPPLLTT
jgi:Zn-dependent protease with chaperone function/uncharacterized tellurite resistance protein B-like protein